MNNNYYKNLIYVSAEEYELLRKHVKTVVELGREQEYYDYNTVIQLIKFMREFMQDAMVVVRCM